MKPSYSIIVWLLVRSAVLLLVALISTGISAQTIIVDTNSGAGAIPGPGGTDGMCSLTEAVGNINGGGQFFADCAPGSFLNPPAQVEIQIQPGIGTIDLNNKLIIREPLRIIGPSPTDKASITNNSGAEDGILVVQPNSGLFIRNFEFRNLRFEGHRKTRDSGGLGAGCQYNGAALCVQLLQETHSLDIIDSEFVQNTVDVPNQDSKGGAVSVFHLGAGKPRVLIENSLFLLNTAGNQGGALWTSGIDLTVRNTRFDSNESVQGGGISVDFADNVLINSSSFIANFATEPPFLEPFEAAALKVENTSTVLLTNNRFLQNVVFERIGSNFFANRGATILIEGRPNLITTLLMVNNEVGNNGAAGLHLSDSTATIAASTFHNNRYAARRIFEHFGAGASFIRSSVDMVNSSIVNNRNSSSGNGTLGVGGVHARESQLNFEHVSISDNESLLQPRVGGLYMEDASTADFSGTLLAGNFGTTNGNVALVDGSVLNLHSSQFGDSASEINGTNTANVFNNTAGLGAVQDMGCSSKAGVTSDNACVPLAPLSPGAVALDRSDPSTNLISDQRGFLFTRASGGGNVPDIGAHELQPPIITLDANINSSLPEGNSGLTPFPFTLLRNGDQRNSTIANWSLTGSGSNPADADDFDPASWAGGSVFFNAGQSTAPLNIDVIGDVFLENNETFRVELGNLTNGVAGSTNSSIGTIINDDSIFATPTVSLTPISTNLIEGNFIIGSEQRLQITRSQNISGVCSFQAQLSGIGPNPVDSDDFINRSLGSVTFIMSPGQEFAEVLLQVNGDGLFEGDEGWRVDLINPTGCIIDNTASFVEGLILDDESQFSITALTTAAPEGTGGSTTPFTFEISRVGYLEASAGVRWEVIGSGSNPATPDDFVGGVFPTGGVPFLPNTIGTVITVEVNADSDGEFDEQFEVRLINPSGGEIGNGSAISTIVNDDATDLLFSDSFE